MGTGPDPPAAGGDRHHLGLVSLEQSSWRRSGDENRKALHLDSARGRGKQGRHQEIPAVGLLELEAQADALVRDEAQTQVMGDLGGGFKGSKRLDVNVWERPDRCSTQAKGASLTHTLADVPQERLGLLAQADIRHPERRT